MPVTTILLNALARGKNDAGVISYKFNLRSKLRGSMGDLEKNLDYAMATLVDPRYKFTFFQDSANVDAAKASVINLIKAEIPYEDSEPAQQDRRSSASSVEVEQENVSIMGQIAKKIELDKEQQVKGFLAILKPVDTCSFAGRGDGGGDAGERGRGLPGPPARGR